MFAQVNRRPLLFLSPGAADEAAARGRRPTAAPGSSSASQNERPERSASQEGGSADMTTGEERIFKVVGPPG
jgi:hypothetical protein